MTSTTATASETLDQVLERLGLKLRFLGRVWPEVDASAKPMKGGEYENWLKLFTESKMALAGVKKNGHKVVIRLYEVDGFRRVSVRYPNSGQELSVYADLIDTKKIDFAFFQLGVEIVAEATASVWCHDRNGQPVNADVGYEGIQTAINKRLYDKDPRVTLHLHAFYLHKIGDKRGFSCSLVSWMWNVVDFILKGQEHASLVPILQLIYDPFTGDVLIQNKTTKFSKTVPVQHLRRTMCDIAAEKYEEGYVLYIDNKYIMNRFMGNKNMKPYFTDENQTKRIHTMVKCKPEISFTAEVAVAQQTYPCGTSMYEIRCNDNAHVLRSYGTLKSYMAKPLVDAHIQSAMVRVRVSWISRTGSVAGAHMIRQEDIITERAIPESIKSVVERHNHLWLCHTALNALFRLGAYKHGFTVVEPLVSLPMKRGREDDPPGPSIPEDCYYEPGRSPSPCGSDVEPDVNTDRLTAEDILCANWSQPVSPPRSDASDADEPKAEEVVADEPKVEEVVADEPKAEEVVADDPKAEDEVADESAEEDDNAYLHWDIFESNEARWRRHEKYGPSSQPFDLC